MNFINDKHNMLTVEFENLSVGYKFYFLVLCI